MYKLDYTINTLMPVIIAKGSGDPNMVATEQYISGSSILGAMAFFYIQKKGLPHNAHRDEFFETNFLRGAINFCNAYIAKDNVPGQFYPTPLSLQRVKDDIEGKTCYDLLFADQEEIGKGTTPLGGFCSISGSLIKTCDVKRSINFHHERDYSKGSTVEGMIFNYESINAGQTFKGMLIAKDEGQLSLFAEAFGDSIELSLGRSRSAQYGMVRIVFGRPEKYQLDPVEYDPEEGISLTFVSPAIIYNPNGYPTVGIDSLSAALGKGVGIQRAFIKAETTEGYNATWRLKRPSETCIAAGSCVLIKAPSDAIERLGLLQLTGLGNRTNEGFGRFVLGLQREAQLSIMDSNNTPKRPDEPMPKEVKNLCKGLIQQDITKRMSLSAIKDANDFSGHNPPTKSLISRLEAMIKKDANMSIEELKKTAKNKLEDCNNGDLTLMDFIQRPKDNVLGREMKDLVSGYTRLLSEVSYAPLEDEDLKESLYRQYWISFFAAMRKNIKAKKGGQQR